MKIHHIVGEHKKGVRAKKYNKKPINTIGPKKPEQPISESPDTARHFHDWLHSEHSPYSDEAGDDNAIFMKALHFLKGRVHPGDMEHHAHHMTKMFHGDDPDEDIGEDDMFGKISAVNPDGTADVQKPDGTKLTIKQDNMLPGQNNKLVLNKEPEGLKTGQEVDVPTQETQAGNPTRRIDPPNNTNTLFMDRKKFDPMLGAFASDGDPIRKTISGREIDAAYASEPVNATNRIGYFKADDGKLYMSLNVGHEWRLGPEAYRKVLGGLAGIREKSDTHVDDTVFAGTAVGQKSGVAGQARAMTKAPLKGKLVGASESLSASDRDLLEKMLTIAGLK